MTNFEFRHYCQRQTLLGLAFVIVATLALEHTAIDVAISQHFYLGNQHWLIGKKDWLPDLIFYKTPKTLLIIFEVYMAMAGLQRYIASKFPTNWAAQQGRWFGKLARFSNAEIGYLAVAMVLVPTITATLKGVTHVVCPNHLQIFGGDFAYLSIWQNIQAHTPSKCFPAAHASAGFGLYAWAFLPSLWRNRWQIAAAVTLLSWCMGGYKMLIGDHFFSHTVVAMGLGWTICAAIAWGWGRWYSYHPHPHHD